MAERSSASGTQKGLFPYDDLVSMCSIDKNRQTVT
jgi:hypothetical protein